MNENAAIVSIEPPSAVFERPRLGWFLLLDGGMVGLATLAFNRRAYEKARDVMPLPEQGQLQVLFAGAVVVHVAEAGVARRMARRRGVPSARWALQTFVVGFPSLLRLRSIDPRHGPATVLEDS